MLFGTFTFMVLAFVQMEVWAAVSTAAVTTITAWQEPGN
jgi:hypothetical protein